MVDIDARVWGVCFSGTYPAGPAPMMRLFRAMLVDVGYPGLWHKLTHRPWTRVSRRLSWCMVVPGVESKTLQTKRRTLRQGGTIVLPRQSERVSTDQRKFQQNPIKY